MSHEEFEQQFSCRQLAVIVAGSVATILFLSCAVLLVQRERVANWETSANVGQLKRLLVQSIAFSMSQEVSDVGPFIEKMRTLPGLLDLRVMPTNAIRAGAEADMDGEERAVLHSGKEFWEPQLLQDQHGNRLVVALRADQGCIQCHNVQVGRLWPRSVSGIRRTMRGGPRRSSGGSSCLPLSYHRRCDRNGLVLRPQEDPLGPP